MKWNSRLKHCHLWTRRVGSLHVCWRSAEFQSEPANVLEAIQHTHPRAFLWTLFEGRSVMTGRGN